MLISTSENARRRIHVDLNTDIVYYSFAEMLI